MPMKRTSVLLCLLTAALLTAVPVLTGCDQVKDAAHNAKNAVTSLADKFTNFELEQEADALNNIVKNFQNGILNGTINSTTKGNSVTAVLPKPDATAAERTAALQTLTLFSALEEQGVTSRYPEEKMSDFVSSNGTIKYKGNLDPKEEVGLPLTYMTTIAAILNLS